MVRRAATQTGSLALEPAFSVINLLEWGGLDDMRYGPRLLLSLKDLRPSSQASLHVAGRSTQFDVHCSNQRLYF